MRIRSRMTAIGAGAVLVAGGMLAGIAPAHAVTDLGGINISNWCKHWLGDITQVVNINNQWDGWRCARDANLYQINLNNACNWQYGGGAWANHTSSSMYSWRCYR